MSDPQLQYNKITYNGKYGVWTDNALSQFSYNEISHNGEFELYYTTEKEVSFQALNNFWGTVDRQKIRDKIFGKVEFIKKSSLRQEVPAKKDYEKRKRSQSAEKGEGQKTQSDPWESLRKTFEQN